MGVGAKIHDVDVSALGEDLSIILADKAKEGSDILQRIQNARKKGGIKMYAEVYQWFTETSGLGLAEQAARLMDPKAAGSEAVISEAIEAWIAKTDRLARHGKQYELPEAYKKVALKKILVGKARENCELWESEKYSYEDILQKVREYARSKKLDKDASSGKPGVDIGAVEQERGRRMGDPV